MDPYACARLASQVKTRIYIKSNYGFEASTNTREHKDERADKKLPFSL